MGLAVVSGGGTGIGAAIAAALAEDGYDVVIIGRRAEVLAATAARLSPAKIRTVVADLGIPAEVARAVGEIGEAPVDVLVNNAGGNVGSPGQTLSDVDAYWRASFESNVLTAVLLTEALLPQLTRPGATVVAIGSVAGQRGGAAAYSAAKAALHRWTVDLATRLGQDGITANVVSPGYIAQTEFFGDRLGPDGHAARIAQTLVGRAGTPADVAGAVRYFVDARYVTGQVLAVNGGSLLGH